MQACLIRVDAMKRFRLSTLILLLVAFCCTLPVLAATWLFFESSIDNWLHQRRFDAVLWKANVWDKEKKEPVYGGMWPPRLCMVDDLMAGNRLLLMPKSQVVDLLGPPDQKTELIGTPERFIGATFTYVLGPERGFIRIDSEALVLEFDADDKVSSQYIYQD